LDVRDQLAADPLVGVAVVHEHAGQFRFPLVRVLVHGGAGHGVAIDLENEEVADLLFQVRPRPLDEFVRLDALLDEAEDGSHVLLLSRADRLVFVGVNERADPFVGEDLAQEPFLFAAVDDVDAFDAFLAGANGMIEFSNGFAGQVAALLLEKALSFLHGHLADHVALGAADAAFRREVNELDGAESLGDLDGHGIGIEAIRVADAVAAERRYHWDDVFFEKRLQEADIDAFDAAG